MSQILVIRCRENGPLVIQGPVKVIDHRGDEFVPPVGKDSIALCRCGHSGNKPFCDGSHKGTTFAPKKFTAEKDGDAWLCQCKHTGNAPFCDGTHKTV